MTEHTTKSSDQRRKVIIGGVSALVGFLVVGGGIYLYVASRSIYIDQSVISAPIIKLAPKNSGVLEETFVHEGDRVVADQAVARVGDEIVKAKTAGQIVSVNNNIGEFVNAVSGQGTVASLVDSTQLRVVGHIQENKGLAAIRVGDAVTFTVDTFGSKAYQGILDEISQTSRASDVVFDISSQRPTNEFDVKVRFDPAKYPELKNGMSARMWIYKQ